ncbi:radical SAM protein, partial [PVC group bacterium]|nr:radical SAM protein [PVC group bacterium]
MIPNSHCESATGPDITSLELEITRKCPLACTYCYRSLRDPANTDRETSMSLETATRAIEWALGRLPLRTRNLGVWFMGGEPLVEFALIKRLVEYGESRAADLGKTITFGATTNLVLIDEEIISFWREHRMKWNTSTDGAPASHDACRVFPDGRGSADAVRRKIPLVLEHWPNTTARATVTPQSAARILENARYLLDLGYTNIVMVASTDQAWPNDGLATLAGSFSDIGDFFIERFRRGQPFRLKWFDSAVKGIVKPQRGTGPCGAGRGMVCVDVHGEIWPCHRFPGYDPEGFWRLGSVDEGLDEEKRLPLLGFDCRRDV